MEFPLMTRRLVREWLDLATDPDICAVEQEEAMRAEHDEIDRIVAAVDDELAAERRASGPQVPRVTRTARRQRHANRRAGREVLRSLPVRLDPGELAAGPAELGGEAA